MEPAPGAAACDAVQVLAEEGGRMSDFMVDCGCLPTIVFIIIMLYLIVKTGFLKVRLG